MCSPLKAGGRSCAARVALVLAVLIVAQSALAQPQSQALRLTVVHFVGDVLSSVVIGRELLPAEGLDATVQTRAAGMLALQDLLAGHTDVAMMAETPVIFEIMARHAQRRAMDSPKPVIIANTVFSNDLNQVVGLRSRGIETPADLAGRRLGLMRGTASSFFWSVFAPYNDVPPRSVTLVDRPIDELADALVAGDIDAATLWEPWTQQAVDRLGADLRVFSGHNVYTASWLIVTTRDYAAVHPDRLQSLLAAYAAADRFVDEEPQSALAIHASVAGIDESLLRPVFPKLHAELSLDWSVLIGLQQQLAWARRELGMAPTLGLPDIRDYIDHRPLMAVDPYRVRLPTAGLNGVEH